jgi:hypothetical protein
LKLGSMIGKPIHCDIPTTTMSRLSYARILWLVLKSAFSLRLSIIVLH